MDEENKVNEGEANELRKDADDIAEDHREEGESIDDLRRQIEQLTRERDEANEMAIRNGQGAAKLESLSDMLRELVGKRGD